MFTCAGKFGFLFVGILALTGAGSVFAPATFTYDITKDDWKLLENVAEPKEIKISDLQMVSFLKSGERYIKGEEMRRRAKEMKCNFGQTTAEYLLAHKEEIPAKFRKHYLVFPGTVWQDPDGGHAVPYLGWDGDRWFLYFLWLDGAWIGNDRLLSARKLN